MTLASNVASTSTEEMKTTIIEFIHKKVIRTNLGKGNVDIVTNLINTFVN